MYTYVAYMHHIGSFRMGGIAISRVCLFVCLFVRSFVRWCVFVNVFVNMSSGGANILKTVGDRGSVPMHQQQEMAYGESNGHVIDDIT